MNKGPIGFALSPKTMKEVVEEAVEQEEVQSPSALLPPNAVFYHNPDPRLRGMIDMLLQEGPWAIELGPSSIAFVSRIGRVTISAPQSDIHITYDSPFAGEPQMYLFAGCHPQGVVKQEETTPEKAKVAFAVSPGASSPEVHREMEEEDGR